MFKWFWRWLRKEYTSPFLSSHGDSPAMPLTQHIPRHTRAYLHEGYRNKTVFRVVGQIARSAAGIRWKHYSDQSKQREYHHSTLLKLWQKPNPQQGGASFREQMLAYYCLTGNNYMLGLNSHGRSGQPFDELYNLRPDLTRIQLNSHGIDHYEFGPYSPYKSYHPTAIMHNKLFSGSDDLYGLAPIEVAAMLVDIQKAGQRWNLALLSNMARPGGAWITDQLLNNQDYLHLKREIREKFAGPRSAGETVILHGGVHWQSLAMTPMELDFLSTDLKTDRDIAGIFFNFPVYLLGLSDSTYANLREARHFLYTDIVFPLLDMFVDSLNAWLTPRYGGFLDYDREDVDTIQEQLQSTKKDASIRAGQEWLQGTSTFHETRNRQGKELLPCEDFLLLNNVPVPINQLNRYIQQLSLPAKSSPSPFNQTTVEEDTPLPEIQEKTSTTNPTLQGYSAFQRHVWTNYTTNH